jgi:hypothetical protein
LRKSAELLECNRVVKHSLGKERKERARSADTVGTLKRWECPSPLFFVSVASKGVRISVRPLFAALAGSSISVAAEGLTGWAAAKRIRVWDGKISSVWEGPTDWRRWRSRYTGKDSMGVTTG